MAGWSTPKPANYGFVYVMVNDVMPHVFKIGCTERSPHARAAELSAPTSIPNPFKVLCFAEIADFQTAERDLHEQLSAARYSPQREFFHIEAIRWAVGGLYWHPLRLSMSLAANTNDLFVWGVFDENDSGMHNVPNPWEQTYKPKQKRELGA